MENKPGNPLNKPTHFQICKQIQDALRPFLYIKVVKKNEIILTEGNTCKSIYFIRSGSIKQYYLSDGKEFILGMSAHRCEKGDKSSDLGVGSQQHCSCWGRAN